MFIKRDIEESAKGLFAYEVKWSPKKEAKPLPRTFLAANPDAVCLGISPGPS